MPDDDATSIASDPLRADERPVRCPRCGYDQRGVMQAWTEACPMQGVCSECGLELDWGPVVHPEKFEPLWCVEFARTILGFPRTVIRTLLHSFLPWLFWRDLKMSDPIRWGRLLSYVIVLLMLLPASYVLEQGAVATRVYVEARSVSTNKNFLFTYMERSTSSAPWSADISQQQRMLIWRNRSMLYTVYRTRGASASLACSWPELTIHAIANPHQRIATLNLTGPWGTMPLTPTTGIHEEAYFASRSWRGGSPLTYIWERSLGWLVAGLIPAMGIPLGFIFLPISRKRAKVRWEHVARIALYSVFIPVLTLSLFALAMGAHFSIDVTGERMLGVMRWLSRWPMLVGLNVWWIFAIARYLKMPHGWAIAPLLTLMSILLVGAITYLTAPSILINA